MKSEIGGGSDWVTAVNLDLPVLVLWDGMWASFLKIFLDVILLKLMVMTRGGDCREKEAALFLSLPQSFYCILTPRPAPSNYSQNEMI